MEVGDHGDVVFVEVPGGPPIVARWRVAKIHRPTGLIEKLAWELLRAGKRFRAIDASTRAPADVDLGLDQHDWREGKRTPGRANAGERRPVSEKIELVFDLDAMVCEYTNDSSVES